MADPEAAPDWFTEAITAPVQAGTVPVGSATISFRAWGEPDRPGLVLIHGGAAHSRWWDHIAPALSARRRVVALDLAGHGDSSHAGSYDLDTWGDQVLAAAGAGRIAGLPTLVGHSLGGLVAISAAMTRPEWIRDVVAVDSSVRIFTAEEQAVRDRRAGADPPPFATREEAIRRFHPRPQAPEALPWIVRHIAEASIRPVTGGWAWKFDRRTYLRRGVDPETLRPVPIPVRMVRAGAGILTPEKAASTLRSLGQPVEFPEIPGASHQVMIDRPLEFVAALSSLLR